MSDQYDVRVGEPVSTKLWQAEFERELTRMTEWLNHPAMKAYREERDRLWRAKPWHERVRIRMLVKVENWRTRLGEIVAGRRFE